MVNDKTYWKLNTFAQIDYLIRDYRERLIKTNDNEEKDWLRECLRDEQSWKKKYARCYKLLNG